MNMLNPNTFGSAGIVAGFVLVIFGAYYGRWAKDRFRISADRGIYDNRSKIGMTLFFTGVGLVLMVCLLMLLVANHII